MGKLKVGTAKKRLKTSKVIAASLLAAIGKKSRSNKQSSAAAGNGRPLESEPGTYGVVPSEYNIQAQIDWLTAPPTVSSEKKNSNYALPAPSKKPQRGYHRDVCEGCGEGECLMYCDKCPSAFHAICDDPPLPPEDYETIGITWKCKRCRCLSEQDCESQKSIGNSSSSGDGPVSKFFQLCLPLVQTQNPTQFTLSKEMPAYDYAFPGTSRHVIKRGRQRTSVVDVENGMVPRPTVLCYHCHRSCRTGALIQCDKCDLFFHLDCVDPPLTTIPATVWMCPLHVEPYLESTQLTTIALSERVKIWDDAEKPVNRSAVILNFLRKASRRNPMFRRKKLIPMTLSPEVPEMVQNCYKEGAMYVHERFGKLQTLAAACEVERLKFEMEENVNKYRNKWIDHYLPIGKSLVEQRAKLEYLRSRNESKINHLSNVLKRYEELEGCRAIKNNEETVSESSTQKAKLSQMLDDFSNGSTTNTVPCKNNSSDELAVACPSEDTGITDIDNNIKVLPEANLQVEILQSKTEVSGEGSLQTPETPIDATSDCKPNEVDEELEKVAKWVWEEVKVADADAHEDLKAVNELSRDVRRVGEMLLNFPLTDEYCNTLASKNVVDDVVTPSICAPIPTTAAPKPQPLLSKPSTLEDSVVPSFSSIYVPKEHIGLQLDAVKSLPKKTVHKLAACHLRNIRRKKEIKEFTESEKVVHNISPRSGFSGSRPLIKFYIENLCVNVEITKRSFWIGSGESCDWKITDFVKCNRIDNKHAKMFYNPHEQCWEILNYSPHGIYVNNTLFGFKSQDAYVPASNSTLEKMQEIVEINSKRVDDYIKAHNSELYNIDMNPCFCKPFPTKALVNVFEGSAKIYPGHRLQIGCAKITIEEFHTSIA